LKYIETEGEFRARLAEAIPLLRQALEDHAKRGIPLQHLPEVYQQILEWLESVEEDVKAGTIPSRRDRIGNSKGYWVNRGWDPADYLGTLIDHIREYWALKIRDDDCE